MSALSGGLCPILRPDMPKPYVSVGFGIESNVMGADETTFNA